MAELWDDELVGVMRRGHPLAKGRLTLDRFAAASHALMTRDTNKRNPTPRTIAKEMNPNAPQPVRRAERLAAKHSLKAG